MITDSVQGAVPRRRRILVVDDIEDSRDLYAFYLNHVGYHVTVALDGETAIRLAQQQRFDVIVMDLAMPKMDGVEATRRLKTDERTRQIPIIIVSGHAIQGLAGRSEEHTSELQSPCNLVCRLLLEKKNIRALWRHGERGCGDGGHRTTAGSWCAVSLPWGARRAMDVRVPGMRLWCDEYDTCAPAPG